jgi:hypothetical protein
LDGREGALVKPVWALKDRDCAEDKQQETDDVRLERKIVGVAHGSLLNPV